MDDAGEGGHGWRVSPRSGLLGVAALAIGFAGVGTAEAQAVDWQAPRGCPRLEDVRSWLDAVLPDEVRAQAAGLRVRVRIERAGPNYRALLEVGEDGTLGSREVEGRRCEEVARAAVVALSVALTEAVAAPPPAPPAVPETAGPDPATDGEPASEPDVRSDPALLVAPEVPPAPTREDASVTSQRSYALVVGAGMVTGLGTPSVAPRVVVALSARPTSTLLVEVGLTSLPIARFEASSQHVADALTFGLRLDACLGADAGPVFLAGCAGASAELVRARGREVTNPSAAFGPMLALRLAGMLETRGAHRLRVTPGLELRGVRPVLTLADGTRLAGFGPVGFSFELGYLRHFR